MLYSPPQTISTTVPPFHSRWITGLQISANADNTKYDRSGGEIEIFNNSDRTNPTWNRIVITQDTYNFPTLLATNEVVYIYIDASGEDGYSLTPPTIADLIDRIYLGELRTQDNATISEVTPYVIEGDPVTMQLISDGGIKNTDKLIPQPVAGTLKLSLPAGEIEAAGRNHFNDSSRPHNVNLSGSSPIQFTIVAPDNTIVATNQEDLQFDRYWNGTGFTTFNQSNDSTVKFIYLDAKGEIFLVPGTERFNSLNVAKNRWRENESHVTPARLRFNTILIAILLGESRLTDTANANRIVFLSSPLP